MYTKAEGILISYLNFINKLRVIEYNDNSGYLIKKYINESIKDIETLGGKVRLIEDNLLSLIEFNENQNICRM
jgi:hypothetical protein